MSHGAARTRRRLRQAVLAIGAAALVALAWSGYLAADSQAAWEALWSLCAGTRR
jgi:hypothetical protein